MAVFKYGSSESWKQSHFQEQKELSENAALSIKVPCSGIEKMQKRFHTIMVDGHLSTTDSPS